MKKLLVGLLVLASLGVCASNVELATGQQVKIKSLNTSCGADHFAKLGIVTVRDDVLIVKSQCRPIYCYVEYEGAPRWDRKYSLRIDTKNASKKILIDRLSREDATIAAKEMVRDGQCAKIKTISSFDKMRSGI